MADSSSRASGRTGLFSLFRGENVPAEVMGPRLLVGVCAIALTIIGIVMVYSASSIEAISESGDATYYMVRQVIFALIGGGLAFVCVRFVPYHAWLGTVGLVYYVICMILVVLTAAMGLVGLGAQRWLSIGGVTLQPSEFAKIALILASTRLMLEYRSDMLTQMQFVARMCLFVLLPLIFIFRAQSDLGTTMICLVGILTILWVGGVSWRVLLGIVIACLFFGVIASHTGYRSDRWIYLDPWSDYYGSGFQIIHSWYAFAQGGLFGQGLGNSAEKYLYLPEAETDFIFSIIGEELGFVGAVFVIALFVGFLIGGLRMAQSAADDAGSLLCAGLSVMLVFQAFLNIGMCVGIFPTTGKPLPFISAGGSSLIASLFIVGIMLSVSYSTDESVYERRRTNLRLLRMEDEEVAGRSLQDGARVPAGRAGMTTFQGVMHSLFGSERPDSSTHAGRRAPDRRRRYSAERTRRPEPDARSDEARRRRRQAAETRRGNAGAPRAQRGDRPDQSRSSRRSRTIDGYRPDEQRNHAGSTQRNRNDGSLRIVNDYHVPNRRRQSGSSSRDSRNRHRK
ncbi:MAG: FtsW/RodA/SpoVE family cell cycle protein [Eggerthellaceae bacterium]